MRRKNAWGGAATAVILSLLVVGCGGSEDRASVSETGTAESASDKSLDAALKWTQCMREQGVDIPDPTREPGGVVLVGPRPGTAPPPAAAMERAGKACDKYLREGGPGTAPSPKDQAAMEKAALTFSRCMRKHGIDLPDPQFGADGGGIAVGIDPEQMNSPVFQKAQKACGSPFGPAGGTTG